MGRVRRMDVGGMVYHGWNRAHFCSRLFQRGNCKYPVGHAKKPAVRFGALGGKGVPDLFPLTFSPLFLGC